MFANCMFIFKLCLLHMLTSLNLETGLHNAHWSLNSLHIANSLHIDCAIYNCMHSHDLQLHSTERQKQLELLVSAVKIIDEDR